MLYSEARPLIRSGDLLAWRGEKGGLSRLIRCVTGGSWSHVGLAWRLQDRVLVLEAREWSGVGIRALSTAVPCDWIATRAAWTPEVEQVALDRLGLPYSYVDAMWVGIGLAPCHDGAICSTFASVILALAGVPVTPGGLSPAALVCESLDRVGVMTRVVAG